MTITTCCKIWWICHGKNIERTVDGQTEGRTVRHIVSVSVSVAAVRHRMAMWRCGVACHHSIPKPIPRPPIPCQHTTYPHRLPQLARRQSHFTPTKLRKWQANEPSKAILFFLFCFFVVFLLNFALLLLLLYLHLTHNKGKMPVATTTA